MSEKMNSLTENEMFNLTTLPEGRKSVGGRWVFTVKESSDGSKSYKGRYVAKGYSQAEGIDYRETFAPTANITSIRSLMQIAAQHDLILQQIDVKTAYLNAPIDCEIYMEQAEGFEVPGKEGRLVYKLSSPVEIGTVCCTATCKQTNLLKVQLTIVYIYNWLKRTL